MPAGPTRIAASAGVSPALDPTARAITPADWWANNETMASPIPWCWLIGWQGLALETQMKQMPSECELAIIPQHEERGDHLLTDITGSLRVRGTVVLKGLL
jgi:hypothetical protein